MAVNWPIVSSGDPLNISAEQWNATRNRVVGQSSDLSVPAPSPNRTPRNEIKVRNTTGSRRERYDIMGIDEPVQKPTPGKVPPQILKVSNYDEDKHKQNFVILKTPLTQYGVGNAVVSGPAYCLVSIPDLENPPAIVGPGPFGSYLEPMPNGSARVMWADDSYQLGNRAWALVLLGSSVPNDGAKIARLTERVGQGQYSYGAVEVTYPGNDKRDGIVWGEDTDEGPLVELNLFKIHFEPFDDGTYGSSNPKLQTPDGNLYVRPFKVYSNNTNYQWFFEAPFALPDYFRENTYLTVTNEGYFDFSDIKVSEY